MAALTLLGTRGGPPALTFVEAEVSPVQPRTGPDGTTGSNSRDSGGGVSQHDDVASASTPLMAFADFAGSPALDQAIRRSSYLAVSGPGGRAAILRAFSPTVEAIPLDARSIAPAHDPDHLLVSDGRRVYVIDAMGQTLRSAPAADRDLSGEVAGVGYFGWRGMWTETGGPVLIGERLRPLAAIGTRLLAAEPQRGMALLDPLSGDRQTLDLPRAPGRVWAHRCTTSIDQQRAAFWLDDTLTLVDQSGRVHHRTVAGKVGPTVWLADNRILVSVEAERGRFNALVLNDQAQVTGHVTLPYAFEPRLDVTGLLHVSEIIDIHEPSSRPWIGEHSAQTVASARHHHLQLASACGLPAEVVATTQPSIRLEGGPTGAAPHDGNARCAQIGGRPRLPADVTWPHAGREPMAFLAQLDLAEIHAGGIDLPLPATGRLLVFGHLDPEGHVPGESERAVIILASDEEDPLAPWPSRLDRSHRFDPVTVSSAPFESVREVYQDLRELAPAGEDLLDRYLTFVDAVHPPRPDHRCFGFHRALQRDDVPDPDSPHQTLLLQLDTDARLGAFWGPGGMVYVYASSSELAALTHDRTGPAVAYGTLYLDD